MKRTLILLGSSLHGPKITEQISQKIAGKDWSVRRTLGTLGESNPSPTHFETVQIHPMKVQRFLTPFFQHA